MAHRRLTRLDQLGGALIFLAILLVLGGLLWVATESVRDFPLLAMLASLIFLGVAGWVANLSLSS
jgi:hypothetical protein